MGNWLTSAEAAEILTKNSGHQVSPKYVMQMGAKGMIRNKLIGKRMHLYWRKDIETRTVRKKGPPRKKTVEQGSGELVTTD
jgi:hypothetical protein